MNRLKEKYQKEVTPALMSKFNYKSIMEVPKIEKIIINTGVGDAVQNAKVLDNAVEELSIITGQKPVVTRAKKNQSQDSAYVKVCQLALKLHFAESVCMSFLTN